ncbi:cytochrome b subunit of succinate dehydrogenase SDH3, partial [Favolaschia claudopus]
SSDAQVHNWHDLQTHVSFQILFSQRWSVSRSISPLLQKIHASTGSTIRTQCLPPSASVDILNKQRLLRPTSPHLTIYKPQLTSVLSIGNRGVGGALSVLLYGSSIAYLFFPGTFDGAYLIELASGIPEYVKYTAKTILAAPFAFHALNGIRHLFWDVGKFMTLRGVYQTGYAVLAGTAVSTIVLVLL